MASLKNKHKHKTYFFLKKNKKFYIIINIKIYDFCDTKMSRNLKCHLTFQFLSMNVLKKGLKKKRERKML